MGGINIKLMQGIDDTENQLQDEKQPKKIQEPGNHEKAKTKAESIQKPQTTSTQSRAKKNTGVNKKIGNEPKKMHKKQVFSFRAGISDIAAWRAYAIATGQTVENIANNAMNEYLRRHNLAGAELAIFEALKAREKTRKE